MTIQEVIKHLKAIEGEHGENTEVVFDCPHCLHNFVPTKLVTKRIANFSSDMNHEHKVNTR